MRFTISLNQRDVRRIQAIIKCATKVCLICQRGTVSLLADAIDFFKAVTFEANLDADLFAELDSTAFQLLNRETTLSVEVEGSELTMKSIAQGQKVLWTYKCVISTFGRAHMLTYINILQNKENSLFQTEALTNLKQLISAVSCTNQPLEIVDNLACTKCNQAIVFEELPCSMEPLVLSPVNLKELNAFKLDCKVSNVEQYITCYRDGYILAVKKGVSSGATLVPPAFVANSTANMQIDLDLSILVPIVATFKEKEHPQALLHYDISSQKFSVNFGSSNYEIYCPIQSVQNNNPNIVTKSFDIPVHCMQVISKLIADNSALHSIFIYNKALKIATLGTYSIVHANIQRG